MGDSQVEPGTALLSNRLKRIPHVNKMPGLNDYQKDNIRRTIQEFFDRREYPTSGIIKAVLEHPTR